MIASSSRLIVDLTTQRVVAIGAIGAPLLHSITDLMEWVQGGFSPLQLWLNYLAFLPIPAVMIGLYAAQRPRVSGVGLMGAVLYGFAFIYFSFTTLVAINDHSASYAQLWNRLGTTYTVHGGIMVAGGLLFGYASLKARVLPDWSLLLFLAGILLNPTLTFLDVDDMLQTAGTAFRNIGLIGMGLATWKQSHRASAAA
jgi:hypothetical protein